MSISGFVSHELASDFSDFAPQAPQINKEFSPINVLSCASRDKLMDKIVPRNWARLYIPYYNSYEGAMSSDW